MTSAIGLILIALALLLAAAGGYGRGFDPSGSKSAWILPVFAIFLALCGWWAL